MSESGVASKNNSLSEASATAAILKLDRIHCSSTIANYNIEFTNLIQNVPFPFSHPEVLVFRYLRGLPFRVQNDINRRDGQSLENLMLLAQEWEGHMLDASRAQSNSSYERNVLGIDYHRSTDYRKSNRSRLSDHSPSAPVDSRYGTKQYRNGAGRCYSNLPPSEPRDLPVTQTKPLTRRERNILIREGLCFHCKAGHHYTYNCPWRNER